MTSIADCDRQTGPRCSPRWTRPSAPHPALKDAVCSHLLGNDLEIGVRAAKVRGAIHSAWARPEQWPIDLGMARERESALPIKYYDIDEDEEPYSEYPSFSVWLLTEVRRRRG